MMEQMILSTSEAAELNCLESVIQKNLQSFYETGVALIKIRDSRLYRQDYATFEEYCRKKWEMSKRHANRLIGTVEVTKNVGPIGPKPETESQARPLTTLPPIQQQQAWKRAVDTAPEGKVTARHVQKVINEITGKAPAKKQGTKIITSTELTMNESKENESPILGPPCYGMKFARLAIYDLEKIRADDIEREQALDHVQDWIIEHKSNKEKADASNDNSLEQLVWSREGSETLRKLKSAWVVASKADRKRFLNWIKLYEELKNEQKKQEKKGKEEAQVEKRRARHTVLGPDEKVTEPFKKAFTEFYNEVADERYGDWKTTSRSVALRLATCVVDLINDEQILEKDQNV